MPIKKELNLNIMFRKIKTILFILSAILTLQACEKEEVSCGCDSEPISTIQPTEPVIGEIAYKYQIDPNDNFYNETFWIGFQKGCDECVVKAIICNEDLLDDRINEIKNTDEVLSVEFSGDLMEVCNKQTDIANNSYVRIKLKSVEVIE